MEQNKAMKRTIGIALAVIVFATITGILAHRFKKNGDEMYMNGYTTGRFVSASVCASSCANSLYGNIGKTAHEQRMLSNIADWIFWGVTHRTQRGVREELEYDVAVVHAFMKDTKRTQSFVDSWRELLTDEDFAFLNELMKKDAPHFKNMRVFGSYKHDRFECFNIDKVIRELNERFKMLPYFENEEDAEPITKEDIENEIYFQWTVAGKSSEKNEEIDLFYLLRSGEILVCPMASNFTLRAEIAKKRYRKIIIDKTGEWIVEFEEK